jgi:hypothetical protein
MPCGNSQETFWFRILITALLPRDSKRNRDPTKAHRFMGFLPLLVAEPPVDVKGVDAVSGWRQGEGIANLAAPALIQR